MFGFILLILIFNSPFCKAYAADPKSYPAIVKSDQAQIAAVVNQHAITERELDLRLDFAIASLGMQKTKESKDSMRHQILQNLIIEKLQESSAIDLGIKLSENDVSKSMENLAKDNNMTLEQLKERFNAMGVKMETFTARMRAQALWARFVRAFFGNQVRVNDGDIEKELGKIKHSLESDQYMLVEIVLPINEKDRTKTKQDADRLYEQVSKPMTNFRLVARQFGAQSGDPDWKTIRQMDEEVAKVVKNSEVGFVTRPIETQNTYRIVKLLDKKLAGHSSFRSRKISVARVGIQLPEEMNEENVMILETISTHLKNSKNCKEFQQVGQKANGSLEMIEKQPMASFPEPLQIVFDKLGEGQVAGPIQDSQGGRGVSFYMVCYIEKPQENKLPTKTEVKENLEQREFTRHAGRHLNKLMATARIVILDGNNNNLTAKS